MTIPRREQSRSWLEQAQSDVRTARAVAAGTPPMNKVTIRELVEFTPGTLGTSDIPTTEYPWDSGLGGMSSPIGYATFGNSANQTRWLKDAERVVIELEKHTPSPHPVNL
jgi:hypothetical protein